MPILKTNLFSAKDYLLNLVFIKLATFLTLQESPCWEGNCNISPINIFLLFSIYNAFALTWHNILNLNRNLISIHMQQLIPTTCHLVGRELQYLPY